MKVHVSCLFKDIKINKAPSKLQTNQRWAWTGSGLDILQDTYDFFGWGLDLDIYFWKNWIRISIFVWFLWRNFSEWFKMSRMMVLLFSLLWFLYLQKIKTILSVCAHCAALIIIDDNSCHFIVNIFWRGGSSKWLSYCCYAALLFLGWVAYVCVV